MIINPKSIEECLFFRELSKDLQRGYLTISIHARTFKYIIESENINLFSVELLKDIFPELRSDLILTSCTCNDLIDWDNPDFAEKMNLNKDCFERIEGAIKKCTYVESCQIINEIFLLDVENEKRLEISQTIKNFWNILESLIKIPPTDSYQYIPNHDNFFGNFSAWGFCFIYLNDETNQGLVISASASD